MALVMSVWERPLSSPGQGSRVLPPTMTNPLPSALDAPNSQVTPPLSTPVRRLPLQSPSEGTPTMPRLTPPLSASLAAPPPQDQEEDIDSEPQGGPESQQ